MPALGDQGGRASVFMIRVEKGAGTSGSGRKSVPPLHGEGGKSIPSLDDQGGKARRPFMIWVEKGADPS